MKIGEYNAQSGVLENEFTGFAHERKCWRRSEGAFNVLFR